MENLQTQFFEYKGQIQAYATLLKKVYEEILYYQQLYRIEDFASGMLDYAMQMRTELESSLKNARLNLSDVEKKLEEVRLK